MHYSMCIASEANDATHQTVECLMKVEHNYSSFVYWDAHKDVVYSIFTFSFQSWLSENIVS